MNKAILYIVIAAVLVGGAIALAKNSKPEASNSANQVAGNASEGAVPATETPANTSGKKMAFDAFIKRGDGSYVCTVSQYLSDMENKGTVYIEGSADQDKRKIRGDFNTVAEGMKIDSSFVIKDGYTYSWNSFMPKSGFKIAMPKEMASSGAAVTANQNGNSGNYVWNASQIGDYDCQPWTVDQAKFALPSAVTFTEVKS